MEEKVKDLKRIFENHKHDTNDLEIETILKESKFILTEEEFYEVWEELQEIREEERWQNYNKSLI